MGSRILYLVGNVEHLLGNAMDQLVETMIRRKTCITCLQETKLVGKTTRKIENMGYWLWLTGKQKQRNMIERIIDKKLKETIRDIKRTCSRIIG